MTREHLFSLTKKDFEIHYFSGTGDGGQHRNKHQNCVRLHHKASGAMVTGQSNKSRKANIREAVENLRNNGKFKLWLSEKIVELDTGETIEQRVERMMAPENLKFEIQENGKWKVDDEQE